jgi:type II secretory pathway pseudopilin PulG
MSLKHGFTLVEVLVAAGIVLLVGSYVGRLALSSREVTEQGQRQTQAAQILARLGKEAQRGNPQVVPASGTRSLETAFLSDLMGRGVDGYRAEVRASANPNGLRDYALRVCWADGCVEGSTQGPAPLAGVAGNPPAQVQLGQGVLEVLVEGQVDTPPDVHVTGGSSTQRVQRWGLTRLENLPAGSYMVTALGIRTDRYSYEAPAVGSANLGAGQGARAVVRYQPVTGAVSVQVTAPPDASINATLSGPSGTYSVQESGLFPYLRPGTYTLSAPSVPCGEYHCQARIEGSPAQVAAGQTQSLTLAYGYASGNLKVLIQGLSGGATVVVQGPAGYQRTLTASTQLSDLAPGEYTLTAREVRSGGYTYRAGETRVSVQAGQTAQATLTYAPVTGRLKVTVSASGAASGQVLQGSQVLQSFTTSGGEWELAPGPYQVQPLSYTQDDIRYEASATGVEVRPGQTATVNLVYAPVTALLDFAVAGLPQGTLAAASLAGPGGYNQGLSASRRLTGLAPGSYRFSAQPVVAGGYTYLPDPASRDLTLAAGVRYTLNLNYTRQEGRVNLTLSGQPQGSAPTIRLRQGDQSYPLVSGMNAGLPTGDYTVEAAALVKDGFTYLPQASPERFTLAHGQTQSLTVAYVRQSGTLVVVLDGLQTAPLRLSGPMNMDLQQGGSYTLLPGEYTLSADPVDVGGFRYAPAVEGSPFALAVGQTVSVAVRYRPVTARLQVEVGGVGGPTPITLAGPTPRTLDGSTTLEYLAPGDYTLTPSPVTRDEPTPYGTGRYTYQAEGRALTLTAGQTAQASLTYTRQQGNLQVALSGLPSGASARLRLQGAGLDYSFAGGSLSALPTGSYTLTPEAMRVGAYTYRANPQNFTLAHGQTRALTVNYQAASGALRVNLSGPSGMPSPSARIWQGGTLVTTLAGGVLEDLAPGEYRVEPITVRDEAGFDYAAPEASVTVQAGQTAEVSLAYVKQSATVNLTVSGAPSAYSLTLAGPKRYTLSAPGGYEVAVGAYTASAPDLNYSGFLYRASVSPTSFTLVPGQVLDLSLSYTKQAGRFRFTLSGLPAGAQAPLSLAGPGSYSANLPNGSTTTPDLAPGAYTLSTPDLAAGGYTWRASGNAGQYTLGVDQTLPVALSYAPVTGRVQINVSGVPSGAAPTLRIVQGGVLHIFSGSASYELSPGSYTLQADSLTFGGYTYAPSGTGSFSVSAGQTTTLSVVYAPTTGRLRVVTSGLPLAPGYSLSGPQGYSVTQADQTFDNVPPGTYTASPNARSRDAGNGVVYTYTASPARATVTPGQTATLYVTYRATGSVVLQINRTSANTPIDVRFNGSTYTAPGRYVINGLAPGSYPLDMRTTYRNGLAFYPSGPNPVTVRPENATEATVTYVPENRAVLNLSVIKSYYGSDNRFLNSTPPALILLQSGWPYYTAGLGGHSLSVYPGNAYSLDKPVGYEVQIAASCGWFGCWERLYWRLDSVSGLPLVPNAGEAYSAQAIWRAKRCYQSGVNWVCDIY